MVIRFHQKLKLFHTDLESKKKQKKLTFSAVLATKNNI